MFGWGYLFFYFFSQLGFGGGKWGEREREMRGWGVYSEGRKRLRSVGVKRKTIYALA